MHQTWSPVTVLIYKAHLLNYMDNFERLTSVSEPFLTIQLFDVKSYKETTNTSDRENFSV